MPRVCDRVAGRPTGAALAVAALCAWLALSAAMARPAEARGLLSAETTCQLSLTRLDHTLANTLLLDTSSVYWLGAYVGAPGTRLRIRGEFPHARYISWNVYDAAGRPLDSLADVEIQPDAGHENPFLPGADRTAARRSYTLTVEFAPKPANPRPNTLYAYDGDSPSLAGTVWYRVYIPDDGQDATGGKGIPRMSVELPGGPLRLIASLAACRADLLPYLDGVTDLLASTTLAVPITGVLGGYPGRNPPRWRRFVNLSVSIRDVLLDNEFGDSLPFDPDDLPQTEGAGIFANRDIDYLYAPTSRGFGDVLVIRARMPGFADTRSGATTMPAGVDTRYHSVCQYEPATQRVIACLADDRILRDEDGWATIVVSHVNDRPSNARADCGVSWLPWGPFSQGLLIYRHMLSDPGFAESISRAERDREQELMGDFFPSARYMDSAADFEQLGCPAEP